MTQSPRKIVFNVPALLPDGTPTGGHRRALTPAGSSPASQDGALTHGERKLGTIMEVGEALAGTLNLQAGLYSVLEVLGRRCGAVRGAVTLCDQSSGILTVEAALGYPGQGERVRYRLGEGITGTVAQNGIPAVIPRVSREPRFLHRAAGPDARKEETTFICVPIVADGTIEGTLSIEFPFSGERDWDRMVKVLRIAAGMISQALRIQRLVDVERQRLLEENTQLKQELRERYEFTNMRKYTELHGRSIKRISTPAIDMMMTYHWPGNVRELENTVERAVLVAEGDVIHGHHLTPSLQTAEASGTVVSGSLAEAVAAFESNLIQGALKTTRGNRARAARLLSTTERIISYKIRRYGIDPRRFRG